MRAPLSGLNSIAVARDIRPLSAFAPAGETSSSSRSGAGVLRYLSSIARASFLSALTSRMTTTRRSAIIGGVLTIEPSVSASTSAPRSVSKLKSRVAGSTAASMSAPQLLVL